MKSSVHLANLVSEKAIPTNCVLGSGICVWVTSCRVSSNINPLKARRGRVLYKDSVRTAQ